MSGLYKNSLAFLVYWLCQNSQQMARANAMASESGATAAAAGDEGYGVLMISDALGATEVIALEKVRVQLFLGIPSDNSLTCSQTRPLGSERSQLFSEVRLMMNARQT